MVLIVAINPLSAILGTGVIEVVWQLSRSPPQLVQGHVPVIVILAVRAHLVIGRHNAGFVLQSFEHLTLWFGEHPGTRQSDVLQSHPVSIRALENGRWAYEKETRMTVITL